MSKVGGNKSDVPRLKKPLGWLVGWLVGWFSVLVLVGCLALWLTLSIVCECLLFSTSFFCLFLTLSASGLIGGFSGPSSLRRTLEPFQRQRWGNFF